MSSPYSLGLDKNAANYTALSPVTFLQRAASVYPDHVALIYGDLQQTWAETFERCRRLASALKKVGIEQDDTVAVIMPNIPAMYEVNFGIPMAGAVIPSCSSALEPKC